MHYVGSCTHTTHTHTHTHQWTKGCISGMLHYTYIDLKWKHAMETHSTAGHCKAKIKRWVWLFSLPPLCELLSCCSPLLVSYFSVGFLVSLYSQDTSIPTMGWTCWIVLKLKAKLLLLRTGLLGPCPWQQPSHHEHNAVWWWYTNKEGPVSMDKHRGFVLSLWPWP